MILEKNKKFWTSKFIFNKLFMEQIHEIFKCIQISEDSDYVRSRNYDLQTITAKDEPAYK